MSRSRNFSAGPGALPDMVLAEAQQAIAELPGTGLSILGVSHRSTLFASMVHEAEALFAELLDLPKGYRVLFLQGGGSLQFSMVPMHLLRGCDAQHAADYVVTGYWSEKAIAAARVEGPVRVLYDGKATGYTRVPRNSELDFSKTAAYLHVVNNETVEGLQFHETLGLEGVPRICDMSSDFLSRPHPTQRYDLVYAHAQKNLGPAGVTVVVVKDDLWRDRGADLPELLTYRAHAEANSIYNTPPVFAIYVTLLVARWVKNVVGGVEAMAARNAKKAELLYGLLDRHPDVFVPHADVDSRSQMNVTFRLKDRSAEAGLIDAAERAGLVGIGGHRSIGGLRVSLYNAVEVDDVRALCSFLEEWVAAR